MFRKLFCGTGGRHPQSSEISAVLCLESLSVQPLGFIRKAVNFLAVLCRKLLCATFGFHPKSSEISAVLCLESFSVQPLGFIRKAVKFQQSCV